ADDHGADQGAFDRSQAADDHDRKSQHDHLDADAERYRDLRRHDSTAEGAQHGSEHESNRVHDLDVDSERGRDLAVMDHDGQEPAVARVLEREVGGDREQDSKNDEPDIVARQNEAADRDIAADGERLIERIGVCAPQQVDHVLEHEERRAGNEHHNNLVSAVDQPQEAALDGEPNPQADRHGHEPHEQKAAGGGKPAIEIRSGRDRGAVSAEGVERAVGDVQDLHDPEDQGKTDRNDEQIGRI